MARPNDKELSRIILFRQYATYRGVYDIYSKTEELSVDDVFRKAILIIMNWMIDRIRPFDMPVSPRLQAIIDDYPAVEEFKTFSLFDNEKTNYYQRSCDDMLDIFIACIRDSGEWSMRITEIDNGSEMVQDKYPLRTFINDFSLRKDKDKVVFAFQTFCREPIEYSEQAAVFKPACMRLLYEDNDLIISEGGLSKQYPSNELVFLNSKSD